MGYVKLSPKAQFCLLVATGEGVDLRVQPAIAAEKIALFSAVA